LAAPSVSRDLVQQRHGGNSVLRDDLQGFCRTNHGKPLLASAQNAFATAISDEISCCFSPRQRITQIRGSTNIHTKAAT
jgi:hypothetical protein